jgi:hypothetical protein
LKFSTPLPRNNYTTIHTVKIAENNLKTLADTRDNRILFSGTRAETLETDFHARANDARFETTGAKLRPLLTPIPEPFLRRVVTRLLSPVECTIDLRSPPATLLANDYQLQLNHSRQPDLNYYYLKCELGLFGWERIGVEV